MYSLVTSIQARKDLKSLPKGIALRVIQKLEDLARDPLNPNNNVRALVGGEGYRLRVGDYRAIYYLDLHNLTLVLTKVKHRKEVYQ